MAKNFRKENVWITLTTATVYHALSNDMVSIPGAACTMGQYPVYLFQVSLLMHSWSVYCHSKTKALIRG